MEVFYLQSGKLTRLVCYASSIEQKSWQGDELRGTVELLCWVCFEKHFEQLEKLGLSVMSQQVIHPMVKFQRQVRSLVESGVVKSTDSIWKIALLYGDDWLHWKHELEEFEFSMQDPISDLLAVESWEDE